MPHIYRFFATGYIQTPSILEEGVIIPKPRAGGNYAITGQVISWNENTKETRMYVEKEATSMKLVKDSLTRAGVTQIQVCTFPHTICDALVELHKTPSPGALCRFGLPI